MNESLENGNEGVHQSMKLNYSKVNIFCEYESVAPNARTRRMQSQRGINTKKYIEENKKKIIFVRKCKVKNSEEIREDSF